MYNTHEKNDTHTKKQASLTYKTNKIIRIIFKIMDNILNFFHYHILTIYSLIVMATVILEVKLSLVEKICYTIVIVGVTAVNEVMLSHTE